MERPDLLSRRSLLTVAALSIPAMAGGCGHPRAADHPSPPTPSIRPADESHALAHELAADLTPVDWGTNLPGVTTSVPTSPGCRTIALTFDACGGPNGSGVDHALLETLRSLQVSATLFLNNRWLLAHPILAAELVADPLFQIENHGTRHRPLSVQGRSAYDIEGTEDLDSVVQEIELNRRFLNYTYGVNSTWFRSGTAHYDDVAVKIAHGLGVKIAGYGVNADAGGTAPPSEVASSVVDAPDGAIILAHMNQPDSGTATGIGEAARQLGDQGVRFALLDSAA